MFRYSQIIFKTAIVASTSIFMLSGCMVGPNFKPLPPPKTKSFTHNVFIKQTAGTSDRFSAGKSQKFITNMPLKGDWWHIFHSAAINRLVQLGISHNNELIAAKAALREAKDTLLGQAGGLLLPSVDLASSALKNRVNDSGFGVNFGTDTFKVFNASFHASYLLDVWGASRRQIETYAAQADYARYEMLGTYTTLTTNIVTTAITIASLRAQIKATKYLMHDQQKILGINKKQFSVGGISQENVLLQETQLAQTKSTLPPLYKSLSIQQHALAVLIGEQTNQAPSLQLSLNNLTLPKNIPLSLPSVVITKRPDVQASQALLHERSAEIGVATAHLLPAITLSGNFGWQSSELSNFFANQNEIWQMAANLLQPLFHGGQLIMERRAALAALDQARAQYEQTVLQAFQNVADALRAIEYDALTYKANRIAEKSAHKSLSITKRQFAAGGGSYLAVLKAQEQYQQTVLSRVKSAAMRYADTAALYQALGGGWWNDARIRQYGNT